MADDEDEEDDHYTRDQSVVSIGVPRFVIAQLRKPARERDMPVARLIVDLIATVASDGLVSAVLDDQADV